MIKRKDYRVVKGLLYIGTDGETVPCEVEYEVGDGFIITVTVPSHKKKFHTTKKYYDVVTTGSEKFKEVMYYFCMSKEPDNAFVKQYNSPDFNYPENYGFSVCYTRCVIIVDSVPEELTDDFKPDLDSRQHEENEETEYNKKAAILAAGAIVGLGTIITSSIKKRRKRKKESGKKK